MTRRQFAQLLGWVGAYTALPGIPRLQGQERRLLVGVSADTLAGANLSDARAASKVWAQEITRDLGLNLAEMIPDVFIPSAQMIQMIRDGSIDCFVLTAWEYAKVAAFVDPEWILVESAAADGLDYALVVHNASPFKNIGDLRSSQLTLHHHRDNVLLSAWLSILLAKSGQGPIERFFNSMVLRDSLTQVVLPVFFRRTEAAGLARRAFSMAVELNPQLGRDLRVLAVSPKVIPQVFCFRRGCRAEDKRRFKDAVLRISSVPAGHQIMALYQTQGYMAREGSVMKETLDLVHQYERLPGQPEAPARKGHS